MSQPSAAPDASELPAPGAQLSTSVLEELLASAVRREGAASLPGDEPAELHPTRGAVLGLCVDDTHPVLQGRVRVRWGGDTLQEGGAPVGKTGDEAEGAADRSLARGQVEVWLPVLRGVTVRRRDRVLVLRPMGWDEPIVVGVVDGFRRREEVPLEGGPVLELKRDEALTIRDADGEPILRVRDRGEGPEIQLLSEASRVHLPGLLDLSASEIRLEARDGEVRISANDDVVVLGEVIKLN